MAVITLTSDYGNKDHYVAALKGALYREIEQPNIVDVTHLIQAFNITEAAFILKNAYNHFPEGTIHLLCVDEEALADREHLAIYQNGHYFIAADNGILSMINPEYKPDKIVAIDLRNAPNINSSRDVFARAAGHLNRGGKIELLGRMVSELKRVSLPKPIVREGERFLIGTVIYVDRFGNLVTNISQKQIADIGKGRRFTITLAKGKRITKILKHYYEESSDGKLIAIINASGFLEIAIFKGASDYLGGARELLGMDINDQVNIEFT